MGRISCETGRNLADQPRSDAWFRDEKNTPCLILNNNTVGKLPLKVIAPITDLKEHYRMIPWMVILEPTTENGLEKPSTIDLFQVRSLSESRLVKKLGFIEEDILLACRKSLNMIFE